MRSFIKTRLNKDNFWNLMFFITFFIGLSLGYITPQPFGGVIFWFAIISAILLVQYNSHLTFDKEKSEFTTSQGNKIKKAGLLFIWLLIISFFLSAGIVGLITEWVNIKYSLLEQLLFAFFFTLLPPLYCIIKNFPIAVYFKKEAWIGNGTTQPYSSSDNWRNSQHHLSTNSDSKITCMSYDYLPGNMYHRSYLDRYRK